MSSIRSLPALIRSFGLAVTLAAASMFLASANESPAEPTSASVQTALDLLSTDRMLADIRTLSGPAHNGRLAGSQDDIGSGRWLAQEFGIAGLQLPLINNGSLMFPFVSGKHGTPIGVQASLVPTSTIQPEPTVRIGVSDQLVTTTLGTDYLPVFDSPAAHVQGRIVFVGYGIADPARGIDEYAGIDAANCIVLFLRGKPDHYQAPVSHADKVRWAREHGAIAYLTATGPTLSPYEARRGVTGRPNAFYAQLTPALALPGVWISTALAERMLVDPDGTHSDRLRTLQDRINRSPASGSFQTNHFASLNWDVVTREGILANVVGLIPGTGPDSILIGAHRDHFGRPAGLFFPGADDNASGTAVLLEIARALAQSGMRPQHTILFVSFSGEERDLLGSRLYVSRPPVPLNSAQSLTLPDPAIRSLRATGSTKAMINIDHAGIGNGRLTVGVTGLDKRIAQEAGETAGLIEKLDLFGFFPGGDHVPFKEAGVPTVTVVSGGVHPHYHQTTDTADTINPEVLRTVARYTLALTWQLANSP
ncbi:MAG: M28 family peptidase [Nitrospira sp.]